MTKLYELKRGTYFMLVEDTQAPPDIGGYKEGLTLKLGNIDGMYSFCTDGDGNVYHPVAWAEVVEVPPK